MQAEFQELLRLLHLERQADLAINKAYLAEENLVELRKRGAARFPLEVVASATASGNRYTITLEQRKHIVQNSPFQVNKPVRLFQVGKNAQKLKTDGVLKAVWPDRVKVELSAAEPPDWLDEGTLGAVLLFDENSYRKTEAALKLVGTAHHNRLAHLRDVLLGKQAPASTTLQAENLLPKLNNSQQAAVRNALSANDVAFIHGPPGTGKTTTLVALIAQTVRQSPAKVLVAAPSNVATDLLTEQLAANGLQTLRIGNPARIQESLQELTLEAALQKQPQYKQVSEWRKQADQFRRMAYSYKRNFGFEERQQRKLLFAETRKLLDDAEKTEKYLVDKVLEQTQVFCATLVGCAHPLIAHIIFDVVFIDEAAQALEPNCWIPVCKAQKITFAGDPQQLPPTVISERAEKEGLGKTLMEKAMAHWPDQAVLLQTQYRMHKDIMAFSSEQFYAGALKAAPSVAEHQLSHFEGTPAAEFIDTAGAGYAEQQPEDTTSVYNPEEAQLALSFITDWLTKGGANTGAKVGIISPYSAQVRHLKELLKQEEVLEQYQPEIVVHTVDGFQGQESDFIVISLVRSNESGTIGFLRDYRRMNVALTRAKKKLIIIGDSSTLSADPFYEKMLDHFQQNKAYRSVWELEGFCA